MRKNKNKQKPKRLVLSEAQKQAFIKGCQESSLTVSEYAKANKVSQASLYRWAESSGVSLKGIKSKTDQEGSPLPKAKPEDVSKNLKAIKIRQKTQVTSGFHLITIFKELLGFIKKMAKEIFLRNKKK